MRTATTKPSTPSPTTTRSRPATPASRLSRHVALRHPQSMKSGRTLLESRAENKGLRRTFLSRTFSLPALFEQLGDQTCPAGLVAGAETRAVVTVKALVKQNQVPPERVPLKLFGAAVDGPPAVRAAQENSGQPAGKLFGDLPQRLHLSRAGGELYGNFVAVVEVEPLQ